MLITSLVYKHKSDRDHAHDDLIPTLVAHCKANEAQTLSYRLLFPRTLEDEQSTEAECSSSDCEASEGAPAPDPDLQLIIYARQAARHVSTDLQCDLQCHLLQTPQLVLCRFRSWTALTDIHQHSAPYRSFRKETRRVGRLVAVSKQVFVADETFIGFHR